MVVGFPRSAPQRYGLAVLVCAAALAISLLLRPLIASSISPLFLLGVILVVWYGGLGPGLLATALSVGAIAYFFLPPLDSVDFAAVTCLRLWVFATVAIVVNWTGLRRQRAEYALEQAAKEERDLRTREHEARVAAELAQQRLSFLAEASNVLAASLNYETTLQDLVRLAVPTLADYSALHIVDNEGAIRQLAMVHVDPAMEERIRDYRKHAPLTWDGQAVTPSVLRTGEPQFVPVVTGADLAAMAENEEHLELLRQLGPRSYICVPLLAGGQILGALTFVIGSSSRTYDQADLDLARELARRAAVAVENARLYAAEQQARQLAEQARERTARLQTVTAALSEARTPEEVASVVVDHSLAALGAAAGSVAMLRTGDEAHLEVVAAGGYTSEQLERWRRFPLSAPIPLAEAVRRGEPIFLESSRALVSRYPHLAAAADFSLRGAWASVPLVVEERTIGAMGLSFEAARLFDESDRAFILAIAHQCAQALDRAWLYSAEQAARSRAEVGERRLALLAEAGAVLVASVEYEQRLESLVHLAIPTLGDICVVRIRARENEPPRTAYAATDPAVAAILSELFSREPLPARDVPGLQAVNEGITLLVPELSATWFEEIARDSRELELLKAIGARAAIFVPLLARGRSIGLFSCAIVRGDRHYSRADLSLAEELARRAALAIDNAQLYRETQEAIRARDAFISIASHELKTPLTAIQGYTELLMRRAAREESQDERVERALRSIREQSERLGVLIGLLRDFSNVQSGRLAIERKPLDLARLLREQVDELRPAFLRHRLELRHLDEPLIVEGDEPRLAQVLQNLLLNSLKSSPPGSPIVVALRRNARHATLSLSQQTTPSAEALAQVIDRFDRAEGVDLSRLSGASLGLYVVKEIVRLHGGTVETACCRETGSTFTVSLPLRATPLQPTSQRPDTAADD